MVTVIFKKIHLSNVPEFRFCAFTVKDTVAARNSLNIVTAEMVRISGKLV